MAFFVEAIALVIAIAFKPKGHVIKSVFLITFCIILILLTVNYILKGRIAAWGYSKTATNDRTFRHTPKLRFISYL